jgi:hypothetical protein
MTCCVYTLLTGMVEDGQLKYTLVCLCPRGFFFFFHNSLEYFSDIFTFFKKVLCVCVCVCVCERERERERGERE